MQVATGHYVNVFDVMGADVLLILNEPNGAPLPEEVGMLEAVMARAIRGHVGANGQQMVAILNDAVENTKCECIAYGFQIIVRYLPRIGAAEYSNFQDE